MSGDSELEAEARPVSSGSQALDYILGGGYASNRVHLIEDMDAFGERLSDEHFIEKPYRMTEIASRVGAALGEARADTANVITLRC